MIELPGKTVGKLGAPILHYLAASSRRRIRWRLAHGMRSQRFKLSATETCERNDDNTKTVQSPTLHRPTVVSLYLDFLTAPTIATIPG